MRGHGDTTVGHCNFWSLYDLALTIKSAYYLNRGGIFVDVNDQRKGTCVQDNSDSLNCQDAIFWKRTAVSQLVCNWDAPSTPSPQPSGPFKFMVVGDSISHGMEADWTWRGRLYEWCK